MFRRCTSIEPHQAGRDCATACLRSSMLRRWTLAPCSRLVGSIDVHVSVGGLHSPFAAATKQCVECAPGSARWNAACVGRRITPPLRGRLSMRGSYRIAGVSVPSQSPSFFFLAGRSRRRRQGDCAADCGCGCGCDVGDSPLLVRRLDCSREAARRSATASVALADVLVEHRSLLDEPQRAKEQVGMLLLLLLLPGAGVRALRPTRASSADQP